MGKLSSSCILCRRNRASQSSLPIHHFSVCVDCAASLGRFILAADPGVLDDLWFLSHAGPAVRAGATANGLDPVDEIDVEDVREIVRELRSEAGGALDAETCADVAGAMLELGMHRDALLSAAAALRTRPGSSAMSSALHTVLDPRLIRPDAVRSLRDRLYPS